MTRAFCPGHITCFFSPVVTDDPITTGSVGAGIRLNKGVLVTIEERTDRTVSVTADGKRTETKLFQDVIGTLAPGRGFDVTVDNQLPVSQGMGMSAAGAVAAGLCASVFSEKNEFDAYKAAHIAELRNKSGMGDVAGILGGRQPIRVSAGLPPFGRTIDTGLRMNVTIAVLGPKISTDTVLSNGEVMRKISAAGKECVNSYLNIRTERALYELSSRFSSSVGLETAEIKDALSLLRKDHGASMCMLGNSIFTNASEKTAIEVLGADAHVISCSSGAEGPKIIRRA